jgi:serine/threonine protein kinase
MVNLSLIYHKMASESHKKVFTSSSQLSITQQSDLFNFLQSTRVYSIGTYTLGRTIGEGTFGKVKLATHILSGRDVKL